MTRLCTALLLFPGVLSAIACGGSLGNDDLEQNPSAIPSNNGKTAGGGAQTSSPTRTTIFACDFNGGEWPSPRPSRILVEWFGGQTFGLDGQELTVTQVDKEGPWNDNRFDYLLRAADGRTLALAGRSVPAHKTSFELIVQEAGRSSAWWLCPDMPLATSVLDDGTLDALVNETGGTRTLCLAPGCGPAK